MSESTPNTRATYTLVGIISLIAVVINAAVRWPPFEKWYGIGDALSILLWIGGLVMLAKDEKVIRNIFYFIWFLALGNLVDEVTDRYMVCTSTEIIYTVVLFAWFLYRSLKES